MAEAKEPADESKRDITSDRISIGMPAEPCRAIVGRNTIYQKIASSPGTIPRQSLTWCRADNYSFTVSGDEDCLFVSVFAAPNTSDLPIMVWIRMYHFGSSNWQATSSLRQLFVV